MMYASAKPGVYSEKREEEEYYAKRGEEEEYFWVRVLGEYSSGRRQVMRQQHGQLNLRPRDQLPIRLLLVYKDMYLNGRRVSLHTALANGLFLTLLF